MELDILQENFEDRVATIIVIDLKYIYFFLELFFLFLYSTMVDLCHCMLIYRVKWSSKINSRILKAKKYL